MRDAQMDDLIRKMLSARASVSSEHCANENLMAAYLESNLSPQEMTEFESHLADCAFCREVLALSMKMRPEESTAHPVFAGASRKTLFRFSIPIPVLGALILVAILIPVIYRATRKSEDVLSGTQVAEFRASKQDAAPAQKAESPAPPTAPISASEPEKSVERERIHAEARILEKKGKLSGDTDLKMQAGSSVPAVKNEAVAEPKPQMVPSVPAVRVDADMPAESVSGEDKLAAAAAPPPPAPAAEKPAAAALPPISLNNVDNLKEITGMNALPPNNILLGSDKDSSRARRAASRQIKDKEFYRNAGMWIDRKCTEHREEPIIEILPEAPEYKSILKSYPELRNLLPAVIYWNKTNYLLR